jgi:hypothetical protein
MAGFKTLAGPVRDAASFRELPPFINITTTPYDLHLSNTLATGCESGGVANGVGADFDGDYRYGNASYTGTGSAMDIGADEMDGVPNFTCDPPAPGSTLATSNPLCLGQNTILSLQNPPTGTGSSYQWQSSTNGVTYTNISGAIYASYTATPLVPTWYQCIVTCANGPTFETSTPVKIDFYGGIASVTNGARCGVGSVDLEAVANGTGTISWYNVPTGGASLGTGSPFSTPTISSTTTFYVAEEVMAPGTVILGTGVTTTSTTGITPYTSYYESERIQYLVRASELTALGLAGGNITSLAFQVTASGPGTYPQLNFNIKMANTADAAFSGAYATPIGSFTTVFTNSSEGAPAVGWKTYTFTTPFVWDGVSNVVIDVCHENDPTSTCSCYSTSSTVAYTNTTFNSVYGKYADNAYACNVVPANTISTFTNRPNMAFGGTSVCGSPRTAVVATVNPAPTLVVTSPQAVCNNSVAAVTVTSNHSDFSTYQWSPIANLYTDAGCTVPYTGNSATTVYYKTATAGAHQLLCTANNPSTLCADTATTYVFNLPSAITHTSPDTAFCLSGGTTISCIPATGYGTATLQWQSSSDGVTYTDISGANSNTYATGTITATTWYRMQVKLGATLCVTSTPWKITIYNPQIVSTTPGSTCGAGTVTLGATPNAGTTVYWYAAATGGTSLGSGNTFTSPVLNATTTYYASPSQGGQSGMTIPGDGGWNHFTTTGSFQTTTITGAYMILTVLQPLTLASMDIYPSATLGTAFTIEARTGSATGTTFKTFAGNTTVVNSGTPSVAQTCNVNWVLPAGTYYIGFLTNPNTWRSGTATHTFPWVLSGYASLDYYLTPSYQYYFYNLKIGTGCENTRVPVVATYTAPPAFTITSPTGVCNNTSTQALNVTSTLSNYNSYIWSPVTDLYTDAAGTIPYTGTSASTVYFKASALGTIQYTCTATNSVDGCHASATTTVTYVNDIASSTFSVTSQNSCSSLNLITVNPASNPLLTWYANDFSSSTLNPLQAGLNGTSASITGGALILTPATASTSGAIQVLNPNSINANAYEIEFDMTITGSSTGNADGISYSFGDDVVPIPTNV